MYSQEPILVVRVEVNDIPDVFIEIIRQALETDSEK